MSKVKDICFSILFLAVAAFIVVILFTGIFGIRDTSKKLDDLQEQYDKLQSDYDDLKEVHSKMKLYYEFRDDSVVDDLWSCEDDIATLYCYFEQEYDSTFESAKEAFDHFHETYKKYCHY